MGLYMMRLRTVTKMVANSEFVSWYDNPRTRQQQNSSSSEPQQGEMPAVSDDKGGSGNSQVTDPNALNLRATVFNKVAKAFTELFSKDATRFDRAGTRTGWTTTGELGVLRQEQDAQYEFMEELELKIEELRKEVDLLKSLVKAYEAKMQRSDEYLQHCMHWITMAQVFGDVPVVKDRMNWKPGRDAALVGAGEDEDEDEV
ncbi:hypothetical protein Trco_006264 [Trichoderma cornu-damae]|uniref:Uncharacterized protein n=1 Tax=Trichoderma cornu-damae TaxID=654480 RepID=A0A9P8QLI2_9HYPO|nr:hypothetical protein Trco_006264 [Trichoderma cornu-damae]